MRKKLLIRKSNSYSIKRTYLKLINSTVFRGFILPAALVGAFFHMVITFGVKNEPFDYVVRASASSWLQEHIFDLSERFHSKINILEFSDFTN